MIWLSIAILVYLIYATYFLSHKLNKLKAYTMATNAEIIAKLDAANSQITKLKGDVGFIQTSVTDLKAEVVRLQDIINSGGSNADIAAAVDNLATNLQSLDDGIPEIGTPPPPQE